jgi:hypothetical protein
MRSRAIRLYSFAAALFTLRDMPETVYSRALKRAAHQLGGTEALRAYLDVPQIRLTYWMDGLLTPPVEVFFQVVDLLLERDMKNLSVPLSQPARPSP